MQDDAFHGHPVPSAAPPGRNRYALQLVYYTRQPSSAQAIYQSFPTALKRRYPAVHGAIFQPACVDTPDLNMSFICSSEFAQRVNGGQPVCECNVRSL